MATQITIIPGLRKGSVIVPLSKSHLHRLMIAEYLCAFQNGCKWTFSYSSAEAGLAEDITATKNSLEALYDACIPTLPCNESGSTLRFMLPVAMACCGEAIFTAAGRLPQRPITPFLELLAQHGVQCLSTADRLFPLHLKGRLQAGEFCLPGNISSQIVTGLLMALPILTVESVIRLTSPMESRGYVDMTLQVLKAFSIDADATDDTFRIPGGQCYCQPSISSPEQDWSGASFWFAMNHMGSQISLPAMPMDSRQPDRLITTLLNRVGSEIDVSQCPDIFPVLAVATAATPATTVFTGVRRLRLKESDRLAAMAEVLECFGIVSETEENRFAVKGIGPRFKGNVTIDSRNDHRIAMAAAVAATVANAPVTISNPDCVRKSYPDFFRQFQKLEPL